MLTLDLTPDEIALLRSCLVRAIWTDSTQYDAEWIEDVIEEGESGVVHCSADSPMMSRIIRKLVEAAK
jgi:hypothetical protein